MTFSNGKLIKEKQMNIIGKSSVILLIIAAVIKSLLNIFSGNPVNPICFLIALTGFLLFL